MILTDQKMNEAAANVVKAATAPGAAPTATDLERAAEALWIAYRPQVTLTEADVLVLWAAAKAAGRLPANPYGRHAAETADNLREALEV